MKRNFDIPGNHLKRNVVCHDHGAIRVLVLRYLTVPISLLAFAFAVQGQNAARDRAPAPVLPERVIR